GARGGGALRDGRGGGRGGLGGWDWLEGRSRPRPPVSTQLRMASRPAVMRGGRPSSPASSGSTWSTDRKVGAPPKVASRGLDAGDATAIALFVVPKSSPSMDASLGASTYSRTRMCAAHTLPPPIM